MYTNMENRHKIIFTIYVPISRKSKFLAVLDEGGASHIPCSSVLLPVKKLKGIQYLEV